LADVFRIVRSQSPVVLSLRSLRSCATGPQTPEHPDIGLIHVVAVTFPDRPVDNALLARLASCTQGAFWTTSTIDQTPVWESTPVLVEAAQGGRYQAVHLQYIDGDRSVLDSDDASRRATARRSAAGRMVL